MTMLKFTTRGTPYARGRQQGRICRDLALPWFYKTITELKNKNSSEVIIATVNAARNQLAAVFPAGHEECCGIAAGLEMKEMDYFTAVSCFHLTAALNNCTAAGYFTEDGRPVFIKTDDIYQSELGMNVLETTIPDQGYRHLQFHFAGSIWTVAGINECGLAMGMTGIPGPILKADGLLSLDALHTILPNCATVAEARAWIEELPLNLYGFSLTLADRAGELAQIEKTGAGTVNLDLPECGFFLHGNTIVDPVFAALNPRQLPGLPLQTNSDRRMKNATFLLRQRPRTEETLLQLINDRGSEGAVCQTGDEGLFTDFAILCSPSEGRLHYRAGGPDYNDIGTVILTDVFPAVRPPPPVPPAAATAANGTGKTEPRITPPQPAYRHRGPTPVPVAATANDMAPLDLPEELIITPGVYHVYGHSYDCRPQGLYRFFNPVTSNGNAQRIVFQDDIYGLLSGLCWLHTHGNRDDEKDDDQLLRQARTEKLIMTCGPFSSFITRQLQKFKVRIRKVAVKTLLDRNGYSDGHVLTEVNLDGRWVVFDADPHRFYQHQGQRLSLYELIPKVQAGDYQSLPLAQTVPFAVSEFKSHNTGFDYGLWYETMGALGDTEFRRVMMIPVIADNDKSWYTTYSEDDHRRAEELWQDAALHYLPPDQFQARFYPYQSD